MLEMTTLTEKVLLALIPAIFAFFPALLNWLSNRASARGRAGSLALLSNELKFLEQWANLARADPPEGQTRGSAPSSLQPDLDRILAEYRAPHKEQETREQPEHVPMLRKGLLLFRPLSGKGWILHSSFYFLMIFAFSMIASEIAYPDPAEGTLMDLVLGIMIIFLPILFFIVRAALRLRDQELKERHQGAG
jgi:hypothetical protein